MTTALLLRATDQGQFAQAWPYRDRVSAALARRGIAIHDLAGPEDIAENVDREAGNPDLRLILGIGHGTPTQLLGYGRAPVITDRHYDPALVHGAIVHLTSCESGEVLGPGMCSVGCTAFIGYDALLLWNDDEVAAMWFESDAAIDIALASGRTVAEAHQLGIEAFTARIKQLRAAGKNLGADTLEFIARHLCSPVTSPDYGDPDACIA